MAKNFLQVDFQSRFIKTFSVEQGLLEKNIPIASRQTCSYIICAFQDNVRHCGHYQKNYFEYSRCGIQNAYVTCSAADFRIPSLPIPTIGGQQAGD